MPTNVPVGNQVDNTPKVQKRLRDLNSVWKMRLFYIQKLPSCLFWGIRIEDCTLDSCIVSVPYRWTTQNPFRSTYFAALSGAAELSTGTLAILALTGKGKVSMLITDFKARFVKKADSRTYFTCKSGIAIRNAVDKAMATGTGQEVTVLSTGRNKQGEVICEMELTWSFKAKG